MQIRPYWISVIIGLSLITASAGAQDDAWVGKKFMPKAGCKLKIETREIRWNQIGTASFTIHHMHREWLWIGRAWVKMSDLVPIEQSLAYYTEHLRRSPASVWAYTCRGVVRR